MKTQRKYFLGWLRVSNSLWHLNFELLAPALSGDSWGGGGVAGSTNHSGAGDCPKASEKAKIRESYVLSPKLKATSDFGLDNLESSLSKAFGSF